MLTNENIKLNFKNKIKENNNKETKIN